MCAGNRADVGRIATWRSGPVGSVIGVSIPLRLRPSAWGPYSVVAALTVAALLPLLDRLPRVAVVACFDAGHPLYTVVATTEPAGVVHCVSAPAPVVSWTLMVAATLLMQLVLAPAALLAVAVLLAGAQRLIGVGRGILVAALARLEGIAVLAWPQPAPVPIPVLATRPGWNRANPRRGPPAFS